MLVTLQLKISHSHDMLNPLQNAVQICWLVFTGVHTMWDRYTGSFNTSTKTCPTDWSFGSPTLERYQMGSKFTLLNKAGSLRDSLHDALSSTMSRNIPSEGQEALWTHKCPVQSQGHIIRIYIRLYAVRPLLFIKWQYQNPQWNRPFKDEIHSCSILKSQIINVLKQ